MVFCPFCKKEYNENQIILEKKHTGLKEVQYISSCPKCGTVLSDTD